MLAWASRAMTPDDLRSVAEADYGFGVEENLAALQRIVRGDLSVLHPLPWNPREVLELSRWAEPRPDDLRGHRVRLFCCVALLIAAADPKDDGRTLSINETLIGATESVQVALPERVSDLLGLLDALRGEFIEGDEGPHVELARFLLHTALGAEASVLRDLLASADERAAAHREETPEMVSPPSGRYDWVLGLTTHTLRTARWRANLDAARDRLRARGDAVEIVQALEALATRRA